MYNCIRTNAAHADFQQLVRELDIDLKVRDGADHLFYAQFNKIDTIKYAIVAYENDIAVGCGAIKKYDPDSMEIKRMYVLPDKRGMGIASGIIQELEQWALDLGFRKCVLETGKKQPEAIALYTKNGYRIIPNFGQYEQVENSICFEKVVIQ